MLRKIFFPAFFLFLTSVIGCKTFEVPMSIDYENYLMPYLEFQYLNINTDEYVDSLKICVDTGSQSTELYKKGIEKMFDSIQTYSKFCAERGIKAGDAVTINSGIRLKSKKNVFEPEFSCYETEENDFFDGILGIDTLKACKRVTFDFKDSLFIVGGKRIKKNSLPLLNKAFEPVFDIPTQWRYFIPVEINGTVYEVMLDTGCCSGTTLAILIPDSADFPEKVSVKIGNVLYENVICAKRSAADFDDKRLGEVRDEVLGDTIILGNAFFQNHRVQLDFENMQFAMD